MLQIHVPKNKEKLRQQIVALKYVILIDKNEKDKKIHMQALERLEGGK